ncbi:glycosyltransferase family 4 protein [Heyndrickxia sporothermodurans]|uniref:glycosyltransferase family 4 protein n=1 Tax=Heyndrickxia sporothermodurans TaxID=46224 RepID=UPI002E1A63D6|nr:glycosyltransferase family 4 protein [Heyndrickxia sporothermodurans]MED3696918.1 glycosyltransferase family 4 protein [Heyndrickxia sporothermodurans]
MKDVLIIAHFTQIPGEKGNGRFGYLANMLTKSGFDVEVVTTQFSHRIKNHRKVIDKHSENINYKLTMLYENGYQKNVSLKRFYSHYIFGKSLKSYLGKRKKPDIIYCAVPSLDAGYIAAKYAKKNKIKFIIDIQDLWPEAFKMIFNVPFISDLIFYPMSNKANYIYNSADSVIAVSETYMNRGLTPSKNRSNKGLSVFLGTDLVFFDKLATKNYINKPTNEIWVTYIGTLGHSYDLTCVIDALYLLKSKGIKNIKFVVMGDGPLKKRFMDYANKKEVYNEFTGRLDYSEMVSRLVKCDIAVNPISKGAAQSIINKVGDYAAAGLPVLNTQESEEYRKLLNEFNAGINCENNNPEDLAEKLLLLCKNKKLRETIGENSRKLAEAKFDRSKTYQDIINLLYEN